MKWKRVADLGPGVTVSVGQDKDFRPEDIPILFRDEQTGAFARIVGSTIKSLLAAPTGEFRCAVHREEDAAFAEVALSLTECELTPDKKEKP